MKKILNMIAFVLLGMLMSLTACEEQETIKKEENVLVEQSVEPQIPSTEGYSALNWMGSLSGSFPLSQFSIPGTHDSGARFEQFSGTAKCQNLTISEQLNIGVRFLDIRCRHLDNTFTIHHGPVYQNIVFDDVRIACVNFLNSNPTETIIMSIKEEHTPSGNTRSFEQTFDSYVAKNSDKWYLGSGIPTLSQVRGKIVLLRRFGASSPKGIDASNWPDNTTFTSGNLRVQDNYNVSSNDTKWNQITGLFNEAKNGGSGTLYINFTSGIKTSFGVPSITSVSNTINPKIVSYFNANPKARFGIVAMDFADATKSLLILNTNFIVDGTYKVINYNSGKALDVGGGSTANGANVIQWSYTGANNQRWTFVSQGNGFYKITALHSGLALDVQGGSTADGGNVIQWTWYGGNNQLWQVTPNGDGTFRIDNKNSGKSLDVYQASADNGGNVIQWSWGAGVNQKWVIQTP